MLEAELRINVLESFTVLNEHLDKFAQALLADKGLVAWLQTKIEIDDENLSDTPTQNFAFLGEYAISDPRELTIACMNQLEFLPEQDPRQILLFPGFIGCSAATLVAAEQLNQAKDTFKQHMVALRAAKGSNVHEEFIEFMDHFSRKRSKETSLVLRKMGLSRLHLKQCYRKFPILDRPPTQISWTWANTRSIKRITFDEAEAMLNKRGQDQSIAYQLHKLYQLPKTEVLAIVQELAPHLRANLVFAEQVGYKQRMMVKGAVPILFPADISTPAPKFKPPQEKRGKNQNRQLRADVLLEPEPYLIALRAHRYVKTEEPCET